jgi:AraC-like DNA-binding protein/mannose-6-phosphate isomerase-like protein (cupin superfamily)
MKSTRTVRPEQVSVPPGGVVAWTSRHARRFRMPFSAAPFEKLVFIESGRGCLVHPGGRVALSAGQVIRVEPGRPHRFVDARESPMTLSALCAAPDAFAGFAPGQRAWQRVRAMLPPLTPRGPLGRGDFSQARLALRRLLRETADRDEFAPLGVHAAAMSALCVIGRAFARKVRPNVRPIAGDAVEETLAYIDSCLDEPIKVTDLARRAKVSYRTYTARFRQLTGGTVIEYVHRQRIALAQQRMARHGSIVGAALDAGFSDLGHFYRVFRRYVQMTPATWLRKSLQAAHQ